MNELSERLALEIFDELCDLEGPELEDVLTSRCGSNAALLAFVRRMLTEDADVGLRFDLAEGAELIASEILDDTRGAIPQQIGRYRIIRELGRGSMGTVFEAEQDEPRRRVAVKVIREGSASTDLRRRFRREAQALGRLQHRGIAQIFEAGSASIGASSWPFIAMEYVEGRPLDVHAQECDLSVMDRIELVARVCDGVQHAHQKGIIHRDIKPSNVLVVADYPDANASTSSFSDTIGQPKILDFGVSRFTDPGVGATVQTHAGQLVGTLAFMSPEQLMGDVDILDTRCDIYALGVILYQLLTGSAPFKLSGITIPRAVRLILETAPPAPHTLNPALRGDIETVIHKAIAKEPSDRYDSAATLAEDLRRIVRNEPISARPATTWYQLRKFAARNRGLVVGVTAAFGVLLATLVVVLVLLARVSSERNLADLARKRQTRIAGFQADVLNSIDLSAMGVAIKDRLIEDLKSRAGSSFPDGHIPVESLGGLLVGTNATDLARASYEVNFVDHAASEIDRRYTDDPVLEATLRDTVARMYQGLYRYDKQSVQDQRALELRRAALGNNDLDTIRSMVHCGNAAGTLGQLEESEALLREAVERYSVLLGPAHPDTIDAKLSLAANLTEDDPRGAERLLEQVVERAAETGDEDLMVQTRFLLAGVYAKLGRTQDAISLYEQHPKTRPYYIVSLQSLAGLYRLDGRLAEAEAAFSQAVDYWCRVGGDDHEATIFNRMSLATVLRREGKEDEARSNERIAYESSLRGLGPGRTHRARAAIRWAEVLLADRRHEECELVLTEAIDAREQTAHLEDDLTANLYDRLAFCLSSMGRSAEASYAAERATRIRASQ